MYIWIAVDASEPLARIRRRALEHNAAFGLNETAFTLPQHVSLKISFPVDDARFDSAVQAIADYLRAQRPFSVAIRGVERMPSILWIAMQDSAELSAMHNALDTLMAERFGVAQHPLDKRYQFHSTLFMDADEARLQQMHALMQAEPLPESFIVNRFLIGCSETGKAGDYRVIRRIPAANG